MEKLKKQIQSIIDIYKSGNLSKAEHLTKKLISNNPKVVFLYNLLGLILVEQKKTDQGMEWYERGIKIDPNFAMIYNNIGLLFFERKTSDNIKKAENFYIKAISLDKKIPEPQNNLGNLYNYVDKVKEAIDCYRKAIDINSKFSYAHHNLGSAYVSVGKFNEAKKHFKQSTKLNPEDARSHRYLSRLTKYNSIEEEHFKELIKIYKFTHINNTENKVSFFSYQNFGALSIFYSL